MVLICCWTKGSYVFGDGSAAPETYCCASALTAKARTANAAVLASAIFKAVPPICYVGINCHFVTCFALKCNAVPLGIGAAPPNLDLPWQYGFRERAHRSP